MDSRELHLGLNFDFACLSGTTNEYGCTAPLDSARIGIDRGITYDLAFAFDSKADVFFRQTTYMSQVVSHLADNNNEVRAICHEFLAHIIDIKTKLGTST